jgi:phosphatidylinositol phospholipase C delta
MRCCVEEFKKAGQNVLDRVTGHRRASSASQAPVDLPPTSARSTETTHTKVTMSHSVVALLVYTVGVKCRGLNKKEQYAPKHIFSLSETTAKKLINHNRTHMVRIYPKGLRLNSEL